MKLRWKILSIIIGFFTIFYYVAFLSYIFFWIGRFSVRYKVTKKEEPTT